MNWTQLAIITVVTALSSIMGFYKFVYFLSIGYGFAIFTGGITILIMDAVANTLDFVTILQALLFISYGARLSIFLIIREMKNLSYRKTLKEASGKEPPVFVKFFIWIFCAFLYTAQLSPMLFRINTQDRALILPLCGIVISSVGLFLEAISDNQKTKQKKVRPDMVATEGLFKIVRCPNYFGEIVFWTGVFVSGLSSYESVGMWIIAICAYISICYIMFNGAERLEKRQEKRYGENAEYRAYAENTKLIIPFLPIYSLNKKKEKK